MDFIGTPFAGHHLGGDSCPHMFTKHLCGSRVKRKKLLLAACLRSLSQLSTVDGCCGCPLFAHVIPWKQLEVWPKNGQGCNHADSQLQILPVASM